jgi:hypothetical protein
MSYFLNNNKKYKKMMKKPVNSIAINQPFTLQIPPKWVFSDKPVNMVKKEPKNKLMKLLSKKASSYENKSTTPGKKSFSTAAWLSFDEEISGPISLVLTYHDASGLKRAIVDKTIAKHSQTVMLAGESTIKFQGEIQDLKIECVGVSPKHRCWIDDVHIKTI